MCHLLCVWHHGQSISKCEIYHEAQISCLLCCNSPVVCCPACKPTHIQIEFNQSHHWNCAAMQSTWCRSRCQKQKHHRSTPTVPKLSNVVKSGHAYLWNNAESLLRCCCCCYCGQSEPSHADTPATVVRRPTYLTTVWTGSGKQCKLGKREKKNIRWRKGRVMGEGERKKMWREREKRNAIGETLNTHIQTKAQMQAKMIHDQGCP